MRLLFYVGAFIVRRVMRRLIFWVSIAIFCNFPPIFSPYSQSNLISPEYYTNAQP